MRSRPSRRSSRAPLAAAAATLALLVAAPARGAAQQGGPRPTPDYSAPAGAPYTAEEVTVQTAEGHTLAGTLTLPKSASAAHRVAAIVTITGSGPQDRDEAIGLEGYRPFRQLADSLARRGIATLRMDDRGTGASKGTFKGATSLQFGEDIRSGLAYLRTRPEIDARRLGLVGHSEGAVIAPMVALKEPTLKAIVLLGGVSRSVGSALKFQMTNLLNHDTTLTPARRDSAIATIPARIDTMMARDPWMRFILPYDPAPTLRQVRVPVLILTGQYDQQATPDQVPTQAALIREGGNKDVTAAVVPNVNHLFVHDTNGFPGNYKNLPAPVLVESSVIGTVVDWLAKKL
ncbi:MAG TPA: alpha/beta fold hydrolase [Gemmatimonadaceae bacterium]